MNNKYNPLKYPFGLLTSLYAVYSTTFDFMNGSFNFTFLQTIWLLISIWFYGEIIIFIGKLIYSFLKKII